MKWILIIVFTLVIHKIAFADDYDGIFDDLSGVRTSPDWLPEEEDKDVK